MFSSLLLCCFIPLLSVPLQEKADDVKEDLAKIQGKWERTITENGATVHVIKEHKDDQTTFTRYRENGEVLQQHKSQFKLRKTPDVKIFTYTNVEVTDGPNKGVKLDGEFLFAYQFKGNQFYEFR